MEEFLKKSLVQKYKYTIVIVVVYYILPIFVYLLPVRHPSDSMIYALYLWCIIIPLVFFIASSCFMAAVYGRFRGSITCIWRCIFCDKLSRAVHRSMV